MATARPYKSRMRLRAGYGTEAQDGAVEFTSVFYFASTPLRSTLDLAATGLALVRFYGYGNETAAPEPSSYYRSTQNQYLVLPGVALPFRSHALISAGPRLQAGGDAFIAGSVHLGGSAVRHTAVRAGRADRRPELGLPRREGRSAPGRVSSRSTAAWYPIIQNGSGAFGSIGGAVSTYWTPRHASPADHGDAGRGQG